LGIVVKSRQATSIVWIYEHKSIRNFRHTSLRCHRNVNGFGRNAYRFCQTRTDLSDLRLDARKVIKNDSIFGWRNDWCRALRPSRRWPFRHKPSSSQTPGARQMRGGAVALPDLDMAARQHLAVLDFTPVAIPLD
jgi:hypothetical protein